MNGPTPHVTVHARTDGSSVGAPPGREYQELWFSISRKPWTSLVLVPVTPEGSAAVVATSLADVANRLDQTPVTAITAGKLDFNSAYVLADLQRHVASDQRRGLLVDVTASATYVAEPSNVAAAEQAEVREPPRALPTSGKLILAVPPVIVEPLGVAVAQAAGTVVLCIEMEETRIADARKTIELIGRELIGGCFLCWRRRGRGG